MYSGPFNEPIKGCFMGLMFIGRKPHAVQAKCYRRDVG